MLKYVFLLVLFCLLLSCAQGVDVRARGEYSVGLGMNGKN